MSTDPALGEYIPSAGGDNSQLPGLGGVYNTVNFHLYHYAGNNPIKYVDPDGRMDAAAIIQGSWAIAGGTAIADGPFPFGDIAGLAIGIGGTVIAAGIFISDVVSNESDKPKTETPSPLPTEGVKPKQDVVPESTPETLPTPEELDKVGKDKQKEIAGSYAVTETPWVPSELQPPGKEPPPGIGPKILWGLGKILELFDNFKGN